MRIVKTYIASLIVLGMLLGAWLTSSHSLDIGWKHYIGLLVFFVINLVSESQPLQLPGTQARITISGLSSYASLALFPPLYAALIGALAVFVVETFFEHKALQKVLFNTAQIFITIGLAALSFTALISTQLDLLVPYHILPLCGAILVYFITNTVFVSFLLSRLTNTSFLRTWASHYSWELLYIAGSIPVAILLILSYQRLWIAGPLLLIAPLILLRESYAQYIRLKTTYTETVRTLIKVIETHDTYTAGHSLRVAEYAKRLAIARRMSVKDVERVEIAAYLHDLGKVDLAITHLVRKPGRLSPEEKRRVQLHPLVSADLAAQVTYFRGGIEGIIRHHHEHYNGTGYPHGLREDEIPLGSRIILIADAFDAMTSNRMYRSALDLQRVRDEFTKYAGIQFDPELVPLFLNVCVRDETMVIPQIEIPYDDLLSTRVHDISVESAAS